MPDFRLDKDKVEFPHPTLARPDGLLAVGGDLSVARLLLAYTHGIFHGTIRGRKSSGGVRGNVLLFFQVKSIFPIP